ncbi:MAG: hypothetical protein NT003_02570 [Candidatus Magasanikbacteria bacterium]|nr:hypothetical protein [Candidatus Magasanikbacteria bacterium]
MRSPSTILHPQFWAEDGTFWYADAYNQGGFISTLHSYGGYFQTISRLTAWISLAAPLHTAPLIFSIIALSIQLLPALLLVSGRFNELIPRKSVQYLCALFLLLIPNSAEIHGNITNSQWYLAVAAFLILIATIPQTRRAKFFDFFILLLSALSGPFSLFLFPIAFILVIARKTRAHFFHAIAIAIGGALQAASILFLNHGGRLHMMPHMDIKLIFAIFARQVVFGLMIGANGYAWALAHIPAFTTTVLLTTIVAVGCLWYAVLRASLEIKLALLFGTMIFVVSLLSPTGNFSLTPALLILSRTSNGIRYWLIPMIACGAGFIWCATRARFKIVKYFSTALLILSVIGIIVDFRHPVRDQFSLTSAEKILNDAEPGLRIVVPIAPTGWNMTLIKHL